MILITLYQSISPILLENILQGEKGKIKEELMVNFGHPVKQRDFDEDVRGEDEFCHVLVRYKPEDMSHFTFFFHCMLFFLHLGAYCTGLVRFHTYVRLFFCITKNKTI